MIAGAEFFMTHYGPRTDLPTQHVEKCREVRKKKAFDCWVQVLIFECVMLKFQEADQVNLVRGI